MESSLQRRVSLGTGTKGSSEETFFGLLDGHLYSLGVLLDVELFAVLETSHVSVIQR